MALSEEPKNLRPGIHDALSQLGLPLLKGLLGPSCGGPVSLLGPWQAVCQTLPPACPSSHPPHPRAHCHRTTSFRSQLPAAVTPWGEDAGLTQSWGEAREGPYYSHVCHKYFPESISVSVQSILPSKALEAFTNLRSRVK